MKLTIKKEIEETMDFELPAYIKYGGLNKILSEENYIQVDNDESQVSIRFCTIGKNSIPNMLSNGKTITEAAFNNELQSALTKLTNLIKEGEDWGGNDEGEETAEEMNESDDLKSIKFK